MAEDQTFDAAGEIYLEIGEFLARLRQERVGRIQAADREIPKIYAEMKVLEDRITMYRDDRKGCIESLKVVDRRIAELEEQ